MAFIDFWIDCSDAMDAGETVLSCYDDLSKAFNCVDAAVLNRKLESLGIQNSPLNWFSSYLENRFQVVEISSMKQKPIQQTHQKGTLGRFFSWST